MNSFSQLGQDLIVLDMFGKNKFFVDIGCCDGIDGSNTYLLELNGWKGIASDPFPTNFDCRKNTILDKSPVFSRSNETVCFIKAGAVGGIEDCLDKFRYHPHVTMAPKENLLTISLFDLLEKYNAPKYIEYLSLDTEGSELDILQSFPFKSYRFGFITIEHNDQYMKRFEIKNLLINNGYITYQENNIEDYYINKEII
jgi:hypothetical protein